MLKVMKSGFLLAIAVVAMIACSTSAFAQTVAERKAAMLQGLAELDCLVGDLKWDYDQALVHEKEEFEVLQVRFNNARFNLLYVINPSIWELRAAEKLLAVADAIEEMETNGNVVNAKALVAALPGQISTLSGLINGWNGDAIEELQIRFLIEGLVQVLGGCQAIYDYFLDTTSIQEMLVEATQAVVDFDDSVFNP